MKGNWVVIYRRNQELGTPKENGSCKGFLGQDLRKCDLDRMGENGSWIGWERMEVGQDEREWKLGKDGREWKLGRMEENGSWVGFRIRYREL